ncbi:phage protein GemA/Gp16 family protein [Aliarcobacter butzleri]|uniref:phage protein GemA/Gp16 family protein n=1 Tax=Aliarcobacter butzleri TaxID=28197 RepID=UPI00263DA8E9|nr:phage protein GemA/Gp16 family protein [Aliarcobacter butzleri]MDN5091022.1 DUF1018 domain-containing protein [Aliarcobacter butzleri]
MTKAQQTYKKSLIQKIQIVKHNVFIDDEQRKEFMLSRFGVNSTTKLSIDELKLLLDFCNRKVSDIPILKRDTKEVYKITPAQKEKIGVIWQEKARDKSDKALLQFACKIAKYKALRLDDFTVSEAQKIIVALERME